MGNSWLVISIMMTSWHGNTSRIIVPLRGISTGHRSTHHKGPIMQSLDDFFVVRLNALFNKMVVLLVIWDALWRHFIILNIIIMYSRKSDGDLTKSQNGLSNLGASVDSVSSNTRSWSSISSVCSLYYESYVWILVQVKMTLCVTGPLSIQSVSKCRSFLFSLLLAPKQPICRWFVALWRSRNVTVMAKPCYNDLWCCLSHTKRRGHYRSCLLALNEAPVSRNFDRISNSIKYDLVMFYLISLLGSFPGTHAVSRCQIAANHFKFGYQQIFTFECVSMT